MSRIRTSVAGAVARVTLARPEKRNALDHDTAVELAAALSAASAGDAVRVIVLGAEGADFCAGADLEALEALLGAGEQAHRRDAEALGRVFLALRTSPVPVVAAVRGRALAGGAGLATACDIVVAHADAQFGYPEVRIGFVPAMVMTILRRSVGEKRAFELVASGRLVGASEALELGIVSIVAPAADFEETVERTALQLARTPPGALRMTKRLFYELDALRFEEGITAGIRTNVEARMTAEFRDGVRAFLARRSSNPGGGGES